jgi:hypothetical protein
MPVAFRKCLISLFLVQDQVDHDTRSGNRCGPGPDERVLGGGQVGFSDGACWCHYGGGRSTLSSGIGPLEGRRSVPADVWVVVRVREHYRRSVRMQRWTQRQLLVLREATVARCVWIVTGQTVI